MRVGVTLLLTLSSCSLCEPQVHEKVRSSDAADAALYHKAAFKIAKDSGDFWAAQKLMSEACRLQPSSRYLVALGDVESKLGRPTEAGVAWWRAEQLDPSFGMKQMLAQRRRNLQAATSPGRWTQSQALLASLVNRSLLTSMEAASASAYSHSHDRQAEGEGGPASFSAHAIVRPALVPEPCLNHPPCSAT